MKAVVLIGHGGVPKNFPREKVRRLVTLESERQREGTPMTEEEFGLDEEIRNWPRTKENDPYHFGMLEIAKHLEPKIKDAKLAIAYNEFCGPSMQATTDKLVKEGCKKIVFVTTMFTPGGVHSEFEIPEIIEELKAKHIGVEFQYRWPYDLDQVSEFLALQV